jgi:hypothetical protein
MAQKLRGKWDAGIQPKNFTWVIKDRFAVCERPGGFGDGHRRVRRQEEIIWLRENGFDVVVSLIQASHNLHNYEELQLPYRHRPLQTDELETYLPALYRELDDLIAAGSRVVMHGEELGDRVVGVVGGWIRWKGLVEDPTDAITMTEQLTGRKLDPFARQVIMRADEFR